ncbi:ABC transporter substrate-binding protein [Marivirga lumbricoides]
MHTLKVALDWTPNTNHTGFFVAKAKGFYSDIGLSIELRSPEEDNYQTTPAKLVAGDKAHFAIAPSETVISYQTLPAKPNLIAVAEMIKKEGGKGNHIKITPAKLGIWAFEWSS